MKTLRLLSPHLVLDTLQYWSLDLHWAYLIAGNFCWVQIFKIGNCININCEKMNQAGNYHCDAHACIFVRVASIQVWMHEVEIIVWTRWLFIAIYSLWISLNSILCCSNLALHFIVVNINFWLWPTWEVPCVKEEVWQSFGRSVAWMTPSCSANKNCKNFFCRVWRHFCEILHQWKFPTIWYPSKVVYSFALTLQSLNLAKTNHKVCS